MLSLIDGGFSEGGLGSAFCPASYLMCSRVLREGRAVWHRREKVPDVLSACRLQTTETNDTDPRLWIPDGADGSDHVCSNRVCSDH